jgi:hypothetical protein
VALDEAARRLRQPPDDLRRRLSASQVVRVGAFVLERRTTNDVAMRRAAPEDDLPRWNRIALDELHRAAVAGDPWARRAMKEIGVPAPAPRHFADVDDDDEDLG